MAKLSKRAQSLEPFRVQQPPRTMDMLSLFDIEPTPDQTRMARTMTPERAANDASAGRYADKHTTDDAATE